MRTARACTGTAPGQLAVVGRRAVDRLERDARHRREVGIANATIVSERLLPDLAVGGASPTVYLEVKALSRLQREISETRRTAFETT